MCQSHYTRAPEVELGAEWSYAIDIWALGLLLKEYLEGDTLFKSLGAESHEEMARMRFAQTIALIGPAPKELLERGSRSREYFNDDGSFKHPELIPEGLTLENAFPSVEGDDKEALLDLLRGMLHWLPERRKTARELLGNAWLQEAFQ
ncbi:MAG: hypothetical protein Q9218_004745 [Villophora microphyllina]